jgi:uncharacterized protein
VKPWKIRIDAIAPEGRDVRFGFDTKDVNAELLERSVTDARLAGDLEGEARLLRSGTEVYVIGKVWAQASLTCARCLAVFDAPVKGDFHLAMSQKAVPQEEGGGEAEFPEEDLDPIYGEEIDLAEIAMEQLVLALPPYPVCRPDCKGLCPRCGADLNVEPCDCSAKQVDPRLAVLAGLKVGKKT